MNYVGIYYQELQEENLKAFYFKLRYLKNVISF